MLQRRRIRRRQQHLQIFLPNGLLLLSQLLLQQHLIACRKPRHVRWRTIDHLEHVHVASDRNLTDTRLYG